MGRDVVLLGHLVHLARLKQRLQPGDLARLSQAVYEAGGNIISLGAFAGDSPSGYNITMKVEGVDQARLKTVLEPLVVQVLDIRNV